MKGDTAVPVLVLDNGADDVTVAIPRNAITMHLSIDGDTIGMYFVYGYGRMTEKDFLKAVDHVAKVMKEHGPGFIRENDPGILIKDE